MPLTETDVNSVKTVDKVGNGQQAEGYTKAFEEINKLRQEGKMNELVDASKKSDSATTHLPMAGFDEKDQQFIFKNEKTGAVSEVNKDGQVAEVWGIKPTIDANGNSKSDGKNGDMEFQKDANGKYLHVAENGDTYWDVAKNVVMEKNGVADPSKVTDREILEMTNVLLKHNNKPATEADKLTVGEKISIPDEVASTIQKRRNGEKVDSDKTTPTTSITEPKTADELQKWLFTQQVDGTTADGKAEKDTTFNLIDNNNDKFIDDSEIDAYVSTNAGKLSGMQRDYLEKLKVNDDSIEDLHDDAGWDDWNGMSEGDIKTYTRRLTLREDLTKMLSDDKEFDSLAGNDKVITQEEVKQKIALEKNPDKLKLLEVLQRELVFRNEIASGGETIDGKMTKQDRKELKADIAFAQNYPT